jgi:anthranilate synthase component I
MNKKSGEKLKLISCKQKIEKIDPISIMRSDEQDMLLLESADIVTKLGEKSMLFLDFALKIESFNNKVSITALLREAEEIVEKVKEIFRDEIIESLPNSATFLFNPLHHHLDLLEKMRAGSALDVLRTILSSLDLDDIKEKNSLMLTGVFSYDFLDHFEKLPIANADVHGFPDYLFYLPLTSILIDHKTDKTDIFSHAILTKENNAYAQAQKRLLKTLKLVNNKNDTAKIKHLPKIKISPISDVSDEDFYRLVEKCQEHIGVGDVYQIVPSRTFFSPINNPILSYQILRHLNPSPYMFYIRNYHWTLFGASPETFIKVDKNGTRVSIRPIAGTRRRGFKSNGSIDHELDYRAQASLCLDKKELAEHMMLVDLARNDIASVSRSSTRRIKRLLAVDRFSHVMHLVSEVEGKLMKGLDALSAYQASMNMGTLMGAPKIRAAELLRELELNKRGFYGGAIGYIDFLGNMDTAIIIRSALVRDKTAYVRAGCGVVSDSEPKFEVQETINKAEAVLRAITLSSLL